MPVATSDIAACLKRGHKLTVMQSHKKPMSANVVCDTCTVARRQKVYVAFGEETKSFGVWRRQNRSRESGSGE